MPKKSATVSPEIQGYILVTFHVRAEDGQYSSECPELGTASCGDTIDEAFSNVMEATAQYLNAIEVNGERGRVFRKRNIPIYPVAPDEARLLPAGPRDFVSSRVLPLVAA